MIITGIIEMIGALDMSSEQIASSPAVSHNAITHTTPSTIQSAPDTPDTYR